MTNAEMRYCDLVMKGGVTSGVVYPSAILALSQTFRFKCIGGTSAGAIAAALAAAAALGDRHKMANPTIGDAAGFTGLEQVNAHLQKAGVIRSQLQPVAGGGTAFRLAVLLGGSASPWRKGFGVVVAIAALAPLLLVAVLAPWLWLGWHSGGFLGVAVIALPALIVAWLAALCVGGWRLVRRIRNNFFGLCSGMPNPDNGSPAPKPALTQWLNATLQTLAGRPVDGPPLMFGDLWEAPRYPDEPDTVTAITLKLITTAVSHREPRTLPFERAPFWFRKQDFDRLFPESVVAALVSDKAVSAQVGDQTYWRLPAGGALPVVVATRMSLSFPLLFSAVPLYERVWGNGEPAADGSQGASGADAHSLTETDDSDRADSDEQVPRAFRVCWFSDGGICSNFPLHLFDSPLPNWPTFAIDLVYPAKSTGQQPVEDPEASVWLPTRNNQGWQRTYRAIGDAGVAGEVWNFLKGVIGAGRGWREQLQARSPGHRDRIVRVSLGSNEGGLNLDMPVPALINLGKKGTAAGKRLADKFSFDNHYWIRWRNVSASLQRYTMAVARSDQRRPKISAYKAVAKTAQIGQPPPVSYPFKSAAARATAEALLADLVAKGTIWNATGPKLSDGSPRPTPHIQVSPIFEDTNDVFDA